MLHNSPVYLPQNGSGPIYPSSTLSRLLEIDPKLKELFQKTQTIQKGKGGTKTRIKKRRQITRLVGQIHKRIKEIENFKNPLNMVKINAPEAFEKITSYLTPEEQANLARTNKAAPQTVIKLPEIRPKNMNIEEFLERIRTKSDEGRWITHIRGAFWMEDEDLELIAQKFPNLTSLNLSSCKKTTDDAIKALAVNCPNLITLNLKLCRKITDAGLEALAENCNKLTMLDLSNCDQITKTGLEALVKCPKLKGLNLTWCQNISEVGIIALAENCNKLTTLNLSFCYKITDTGLTALAVNCPNLTTLNLSWCGKITDTGLTALAENCNKLTMLDLRECRNITEAGITALQERFPQSN